MAAATTATPSQASRSERVLTKPSQISSPVRAALACPNTTAGGTPAPVARCRRRPPRVTQVRSMYTPMLAVTTQAIIAAMAMTQRIRPRLARFVRRAGEGLGVHPVVVLGQYRAGLTGPVGEGAPAHLAA